MNTVYGYLASIVIFVTGVFIPGQLDQGNPLETPEMREVVLAPLPALALAEPQATMLDGHQKAMIRSGATTTTTRPEEPVAKQDGSKKSSGRRKMVPSDPEKRCPEFEPLFRQYGLTPVDTWSYIAWRESRCRIKAINATWDSRGKMTYHLNKNKSWDSGLLQINSSWVNSVRRVCGVNSGDMRRDLEALLDVHCNLKFAKWIMDNSSGGLSNWSM